MDLDERAVCRDQRGQTLVARALELCEARGARLLYLTLFGSTLYGTSLPGKSDLDVRGIFMPSPESLLLCAAPKSLRYSSGDAASRNTAGDMDMDLWSVQHWLLKLLAAGDTGAVDILFSPSNAACTLFREPLLDAAFGNPLRLFDTKNRRGYAEYSLGQAKKYGIRGSRVGALKAVRNWLRAHCPAPAAGDRLGSRLDALVADCGDGRFCSLAMTPAGERALQLCGKLHTAGTSMSELTRRIERDMARYGGRAEDAERNQGLDFKALSHALRALEQMKELLLEGRIVFPLRCRDELIAVKRGEYAWAELEPRILSRLAEVDALREDSAFTGVYDRAFAESCVLACYRGEKGGR